MKSENARDGTKEAYSPPRILASYDKEALEESVQPHGETPEGGGCGCGCGCGCS
jgi:hypothetical protein